MKVIQKKIMNKSKKIKLAKKQINHISEVKKVLKVGDLITHTRCMGAIEEHYFTEYDGEWICGKPTKETKKFGGIFTNDIAALNVTHINRELVENIKYLSEIRR